jgi:hypothetical protein
MEPAFYKHNSLINNSFDFSGRREFCTSFPASCGIFVVVLVSGHSRLAIFVAADIKMAYVGKKFQKTKGKIQINIKFQKDKYQINISYQDSSAVIQFTQFYSHSEPRCFLSWVKLSLSLAKGNR